MLQILTNTCTVSFKSLIIVVGMGISNFLMSYIIEHIFHTLVLLEQSIFLNFCSLKKRFSYYFYKSLFIGFVEEQIQFIGRTQDLCWYLYYQYHLPVYRFPVNFLHDEIWSFLILLKYNSSCFSFYIMVLASTLSMWSTLNNFMCMVGGRSLFVCNQATAT